MNTTSTALQQSEGQGEHLVGTCRLIRDPAMLRQYGRSGLDRAPVPIRGVVYPTTTCEVSQVLRDACRRGIPVYPISRGKNWGYGAAAPVQSSCIVLDLSRMTRIKNLDTRLGTVEIEPGVSQGQLFEALKGTGLMMDVTGAGPATSIVGNVLERGFGHTPLGLRSQHFVVSEIVLGDGAVLPLAESGSGGCIGRVGLSAGLHELLQQSNFTVVTRMRLMLMRRPEECLRCVLLLDDDHLVAPYIESMRMLKEEGVFDGLPHIGNDVRALSMCTRFDFEHWDPAKGISEETLRKLRNHYRITRWTLACGIYGSRTIARAKARRAVQVFNRIGRVRIFSERTMHRAKSCARIVGGRLGNIFGPKLSEYARQMEQQIALLSVLDGYPTDLALKGCYWRNRSRSWRPGTDPIEDGCGFRWLAPSLPMKGEVVLEMLRLAQQYYRTRGFEFAATLTAVNAKMCQAILSIYYDFDNVRESERAKQLAYELKQQFDSRGWHAYRMANDEISSEMANAHPELVSLRSRIKHAFDPNGILSPGRYA